jgi:hypothetical protein
VRLDPQLDHLGTHELTCSRQDRARSRTRIMVRRPRSLHRSSTEASLHAASSSDLASHTVAVTCIRRTRRIGSPPLTGSA